MNEYISKQNKMIGELINKNLMLEAQLSVAIKTIEELRPKDNEEQGYN